MLLIILTCLGLLVLTTLIHYEVLRGLSLALPQVQIRPRAKLIVVIITAFLAHVVEIALYALAIYCLVRFAGLGTLGDSARFGFDVSLYFSAETYTSLGYGDVVPGGDLRLVAGAEALNGLLLIGWSASYAYIAMERFWNGEH
ncbi:ion channel [Zoogloea sp.]|uniref:ion channel n=1 Tax=Zoogloea sp. TaxID=49181 RepID=UPI0035B0B93F